ncbi:MAG: NAD(P)-dependent oxidoreductase [Dysgonomonas sp.]|nr:NAD(P)-dependent oxidoreductase [Dysgonomonas sp.]
MKKKGVITGATGYIGSNLLEYLLDNDWDLYIIAKAEFGYDNILKIKDRITILEYDDNISSLISFFKEINPDVVFHLAAAVITNYRSEEVKTLIRSNIEFGAEVLESMKYSTCRLFINTGSVWQNYVPDAYNPVDLYAATKEAFEKVLLYYTEAHNYRVITLRLFDIYGENDKRPKLLNILRQKSIDGTSIDVSPGEQYLDMVHISDICSAYLKAYELLLENNDLKNEVFGVYTDNRMQLKEIIGLLERIAGKKINVNFGGKPYKERELMHPTTKYKKLPNWDSIVSLEEGLNRLMNSR